jgi:hypothetical protein
MSLYLRMTLGLIGGAVFGLAAAKLFSSLGWFANEARWALVVICAINGAAFGAWGFGWVRVSNEDYDEQE